ncbi:hypothetical protein HO710_09185 [Streptococcus suis]|nr:hypothetical protein [Streptococcus suis]
MGKAEIRANISYYRGQRNKLRGKIAKLRNARIRLYQTSTTVKYVLNSHEDIKSQYHLAGTPYQEMTDREKEETKSVERYFKTQKEFFLEEIDRKISQYETSIASYDRSIYMLQEALAMADD